MHHSGVAVSGNKQTQQNSSSSSDRGDSSDSSSSSVDSGDSGDSSGHYQFGHNADGLLKQLLLLISLL